MILKYWQILIYYRILPSIAKHMSFLPLQTNKQIVFLTLQHCCSCSIYTYIQMLNHWNANHLALSVENNNSQTSKLLSLFQNGVTQCICMNFKYAHISIHGYKWFSNIQYIFLEDTFYDTIYDTIVSVYCIMHYKQCA